LDECSLYPIYRWSMELRLDGRSALITGGSKGLGRAMAETFASAGANVSVIARDKFALGQTLSALQTANPSGNHLAISADVSQPNAIAEAYEESKQTFGVIDILVNNAGTSNAKPFLDVTDDDWMSDFDLKFFSAARLCRLCIPDMQERKWGRIINTLNSAAKAPGAKTCPTSVARAAGMALTKALATEFASDGVLINALNTGLIVSEQWRTRWSNLESDESFEQFIEKMGSGIPAGRMGDPQEFANLALFLASDAASYVTGTSINIDGGLTPVV
jgi:3-oxoacyl-[acyl-carrier protein] reductase